jgi:hypothetical protein
MEFIDNKYTRIYHSIVKNAQQRTLSKDIYTERHHIIPQSFYKSRSTTGWLTGDYNSKKNLVALTAREHFICHMLLTKMTSGTAHFKMANALQRLAFSKRSSEYMTARKYEYIQKTRSNAMKGRPYSLETREKIRQGNLKRAPTSDVTRAKLSAAAKRRKGFTPEGRQKVIESNKNRVWTAEMKQKLREHNLGKPNTAQKGKPQLKLTCPYCGKTGGISAIKHWHFNNCKLAINLG